MAEIPTNSRFARKSEAIEYLKSFGMKHGTGPRDVSPTGGLDPGWHVVLYFYNPKKRKNKDGVFEFAAIKKIGVKWEVFEHITKKLHML